MERLARFSISLPESLLEEFDRWIEKKGHTSRSDVLRQLIRNYISETYWEEGTKEVYGTVTLIYDHHSHDTAQELTSLQHDFSDIIICSTHIHIDHDHCFEVVVLKGSSASVKKFIDALNGLKSVYHTNPVFTAIV
ncbi:nickel-responsive transcriptional regulator NikR [Thermovirga sp.]|uniref:nickel-responsive transcriptional regulator NikR n=1 Tax=Thermovirga sp. TaxID=2699834 RepID=UPI0025E56DE8|nr:nickel-responsive transcriptional regulator NikR [Thermovirga sp.]MBO8153161.1 nickel-responsive transcriptional regulator NikR [Thermovirga sp.]MCD6183323.1 nickel-responsive transcriptional regulator NikR [Thermovirga sp.]